MSPFWTKKHPPHRLGAGRVKLRENHLESKLDQKLNPPTPRPPEIRTLDSNVRFILWFLAVPFGAFFSYRFRDAFFPVFSKC